MVSAGTWFAIKPVLKTTFIIMSAITILIPILSGVITGVQGGGWEDLFSATGGKLLSTDRDVGHVIEKLEHVKANPNQYDVIDVDNLKTRLGQDIAILFILFFLVAKVWAFIWGKFVDPASTRLSFGAMSVIIVLALITISFLHGSWLFYEKSIDDKKLDIEFPEDLPLYNTLWRLPQHLDFFGIQGGRSIYKSRTSEINMTSNETLNQNIITIIDR